jgi:hypothetical protein
MGEAEGQETLSYDQVAAGGLPPPYPVCISVAAWPQRMARVLLAYAPGDTHRPTVFHAHRVPAISLPDYVARIVQHSHVEPVGLLALFVYAQALHDSQRLPICPLTVHRLAIAAVVVASKTLCDHYHSNRFYARIGGIPTGELGRLEIDLCLRLDWNLQPARSRLAQAYQRLQDAPS